MSNIILSSCKIFRANLINGDRYTVTSRKTEKSVGIIKKVDGFWKLCTVKTALTGTELMDLATLVTTCKLTLEPWRDALTDPDE